MIADVEFGILSIFKTKEDRAIDRKKQIEVSARVLLLLRSYYDLNKYSIYQDRSSSCSLSGMRASPHYGDNSTPSFNM